MPPTDESASKIPPPDDTTADAPSVPVERFRMYIDGAWCDAASGRTFETKNPYTGQVWARLPQADPRDVDRAVQAAHAAFSAGPWASMTASDRGLLLYRLADAIAAGDLMEMQKVFAWAIAYIDQTHQWERDETVFESALA